MFFVYTLYQLIIIMSISLFSQHKMLIFVLRVMRVKHYCNLLAFLFQQNQVSVVCLYFFYELAAMGLDLLKLG